MGLRIRTNIPSQDVQRNLRASSATTETEFAKISSGKRIVKAADDAAGMAISNRLEATTRGLRQAVRNANDGISLIQTAEGGTSEISNILVRLRELAVQSASDTVEDKERELLQKEYGQLLTEVDRIAESTTFNGAQLLSGENELGVLSFHVGAYAGEQNIIEFDSEEANVRSDAIGVEGTSVISKEDSRDTFQVIDDALDKVSSVRSGLGAIQSRLQSTVANLETQVINQDNARSVIQDVDLADSTAKLASASVLKSAGVAILTQANNLPNNALRLIG